MRPFYDDFDESEFGDNEMVNKIMREQEREERRLASHRRRGPSLKRRHEVLEPQDDVSDDDDYDDFEEDDEYDDDEFDTYSGLDLDR